MRREKGDRAQKPTAKHLHLAPAPILTCLQRTDSNRVPRRPAEKRRAQGTQEITHAAWPGASGCAVAAAGAGDALRGPARGEETGSGETPAARLVVPGAPGPRI